jgi:ribosomal protein S18 acetylase RimI-like enzyme
MRDRILEFRSGDLVISTDRSRLDLDRALAILHATDWAAAMPREVLARAIENSVCFGVYRGQELVGLARVVSDLATYAYLTDVVIAEAHRGRGLGRWLVECILAHPDFQSLRRITLLTRDAQGLYARFGFGPLAGTTYMEIAAPLRRPPA